MPELNVPVMACFRHAVIKHHLTPSIAASEHQPVPASDGGTGGLVFFWGGRRRGLGGSHLIRYISVGSDICWD